MLAHDRRILRGRLGEEGLQLRMHRALAAIHHDSRVELFVARVHHDFVARRERIGRHAIGREQRLDIVPVQPRSADRRGGRQIMRRGVGGIREFQHMIVQAVVVVEKAVADVEHRLRHLIELRDLRLHLRLRGGERQGQHGCQHPTNISHHCRPRHHGLAALFDKIIAYARIASRDTSARRTIHHWEMITTQNGIESSTALPSWKVICARGELPAARPTTMSTTGTSISKRSA